jgi:hypothetical protein
MEKQKIDEYIASHKLWISLLQESIFHMERLRSGQVSITDDRWKVVSGGGRAGRSLCQEKSGENKISEHAKNNMPSIQITVSIVPEHINLTVVITNTQNKT